MLQRTPALPLQLAIAFCIMVHLYHWAEFVANPKLPRPQLLRIHALLYRHLLEPDLIMLLFDQLRHPHHHVHLPLCHVLALPLQLFPFTS